MRSLIALAGLAVLLLGTGCGSTEAVKQCRADAQRFADENASFEAEYDSQFGATKVGQLSTGDLLGRDQELMGCIQADPHNGAQYRAVLYRNGFIEGGRFQKFLLDSEQMSDFGQWEANQQATQLASYRTGENQKVPIPSP